MSSVFGSLYLQHSRNRTTLISIIDYVQVLFVYQLEVCKRYGGRWKLPFVGRNSTIRSPCDHSKVAKFLQKCLESYSNFCNLFIWYFCDQFLLTQLCNLKDLVRFESACDVLFTDGVESCNFDSCMSTSKIWLEKV